MSHPPQMEHGREEGPIHGLLEGGVGTCPLGTGAEPWRCPDQGAWGVPPVGRAAHVRLPVSAGSWCRMAV